MTSDRASTQSYEMLWNCEYCGTKKLLGVTHKHCPQCGGRQDPKARYFPAEGEEIAIKDHKYTGVDWYCASCQNANANVSGFCVTCGGPKDGQKLVELKIDRPSISEVADKKDVVLESPQATTKETKKSFKWPMIFGAVGIAIALGLFLFFYTNDEHAEVSSHAWSHSVKIERYTAKSEDKLCKDVMPTMKILSRKMVTKTRQVADGQTCKEVCSKKRVDQGDGSYRQEESCRDDCRTVYRTETYPVDMCRVEFGVWSVVRTLENKGASSLDQLTWPQLMPSPNQGTLKYGDERNGERAAKYTVIFKKAGKDVTCDYSDANKWTSFKTGQSIKMATNLVGHSFCP